MIKAEIEQNFKEKYLAWVNSYYSKGHLNGSLEDKVMREVVQDNGGVVLMFINVRDEDKCLVKRTWDEYVMARDMLLGFYRGLDGNKV
jgi:hypothetical protein